MRYTIIVHGGAGSGKIEDRERRLRILVEAVNYSISYLKESSIDGVEAAVNYMEDSGAFNAGRGACLNAIGKIELDACIMQSSNMEGAGIANCDCTHNAVSLAREVMERTEHVLISGNALRKIARAAGMRIERLRPSNSTRKKYLELMKRFDDLHSKNKKILPLFYDTVGSVAVDSSKNSAAAVSTGGVWLKLPGRIGDSAVIGAGVYANSLGAACATGKGEEIIRNALCYYACSKLRTGAMNAAIEAIKMITSHSGKDTAGIITADRNYEVGYSYNTEEMLVAWYDVKKERIRTS